MINLRTIICADRILLTIGNSLSIMTESFDSPESGSEGSTPAVLFILGGISYEKQETFFG